MSCAEFLSEDLIVVSSTIGEVLDDDLQNTDFLNDGEIGIYSISENTFVKKIKTKQLTGVLIPINEDIVFELYEYPKVISLNSGEIIQEFTDIYSGKQSLAIVSEAQKTPPIAIDRKNKRIAIANGNVIHILTVN